MDLTGGMNSLRFGRLGQSGPRLRGWTLHDVLWWLLAAGIVIAAARLFWMIATPVSPLGEWRPASVRTMSAGARSALMTGFDPFNRNAPVAMAEAGPVETITDLPLTVYGIRYNAATGAGMAIIADNDGEQQIYRIGEEVSPGVTLSALEFDHVVLSRGGSRELLYLDQSQPAPSIQPAVRPEQAAPPTPSGTNRRPNCAPAYPSAPRNRAAVSRASMSQRQATAACFAPQACATAMSWSRWAASASSRPRRRHSFPVRSRPAHRFPSPSAATAARFRSI